jgi:hypothetical protein
MPYPISGREDQSVTFIRLKPRPAGASNRCPYPKTIDAMGIGIARKRIAARPYRFISLWSMSVFGLKVGMFWSPTQLLPDFLG